MSYEESTSPELERHLLAKEIVALIMESDRDEIALKIETLPLSELVRFYRTIGGRVYD